MSPVGITLLMIVAFAGFFVLAWRKLAIVVRLQPEVRWDQPLLRLKRVVIEGLLQSRMIRGDAKAGVMHCVIFVGFMALLARKLELIVIGYAPGFVYPGWVGGAFAIGKDVVELAVLAAVAYAFYRRFVERPMRLEANREAIVVLALIASIMVTDLAFDGFRFALFAATDPQIAHERTFAVVGAGVSALFSGLPESALRTGWQVSYWLQLL
ncbi:MAG TPA: hypothetical protein VIK97_15450, partial [Casimicrobiaceae bacterium]